MEKILQQSFTEEQQKESQIIKQYINNNKNYLQTHYIKQQPIFYYNTETSKVNMHDNLFNSNYNSIYDFLVKLIFGFSGYGIKYCYIDADNYFICEGNFQNSKLNGFGIIYYDNKNKYQEGIFKDNEFINGIYYNTNQLKILQGTFKKDKLNGKNCKRFYPITIQHGEFKDNYLYSGFGYLREDPTSKTTKELNTEQINQDKKIYNLERNKENPNIKTLIFYGKTIGLDRDIVINIDKNNIATLQDEPLTKEEIDKIKKFFKSISIKQLDTFDDYLAMLYYCIIMDSEKYKDLNILIPDMYKYEEIIQTIKIINQIPQEKRKGKYVVPCGWLIKDHQVNLIIDFDNNIFEIINTGEFVNQEVIDELQQELRNNFKGENWIVCENNITRQSTGNCVIASNIVATEKVMLEQKIQEHNKKKIVYSQQDEKLNYLNTKLKIEKILNTKKRNISINKIVNDFYKLYSKQTEKIVKNLKQEITNLEQEQKTLIKNMFLLNQRVLEQFGGYFIKKMDENITTKQKYIRIAL